MGEVDWTALLDNLDRQTRSSNESHPQHDPSRPTGQAVGARSAWEYEAAAALSSQLQTAPPSPTHHIGPGGRPVARRGNTLPPPNHSFSLPHTPLIPQWPPPTEAGPSRIHELASSSSTTANPNWPASIGMDFSRMNNPSLEEYLHLLSNPTSAPHAFNNTAGQGWTGVQARTASGSGQSTPLGPPLLPQQTPPIPGNTYGVGRGSGSGDPSPTSALQQGTPGELADSEDKRVRNTMASAKFRAKKKQHMEHVQRSITELEGQKVELERDVKGLKQENGLLRDMVQMKFGFDMKDQLGGGSGDPPDNEPNSHSGGSGSTGKRSRRKGNDEDLLDQ